MSFDIQCTCTIFILYYRWPVDFFGANPATVHQHLLGDMNSFDYVMADSAYTNRSFVTMLFPQKPQNSNWIFMDIYFREHGKFFIQDVMHVFKKSTVIWKQVRYIYRYIRKYHLSKKNKPSGITLIIKEINILFKRYNSKIIKAGT